MADATEDRPAADIPEPARPRALLVVGAPRSGTTLLGNYLGSSPRAVNLGEYGGFHLAFTIAPTSLGAMPGPFRDAYLTDLVAHARGFAEDLAAERGCTWYCDATPWNVLAARRLGADLPTAVFVLTLRHFSGTIQSLRRSFAGGFTWAGATWPESASIWSRFYAAVPELPADRTIPVSYEALTSDPAQTLAVLRMRLGEHGFDTSELDARELATSHAPPIGTGPRPTIGRMVGGAVELCPIPSFDARSWSGDIHRMVWPVVRDVHRELKLRFPGVYRSPPSPGRMRAHHEIEGLVEAELEDGW